MPTTATARGPMTTAGARRPAPRARPMHAEPRKPPKPALSQLAWGLLIGTGAFVAFLIIYLYGAAGLASIGGRADRIDEAPEGAPTSATTVYRDMRDGRVMVMEVDEKGTRIIGIVPKEDVPMAGNMYRETRSRGLDTTTRLNAFSKTFK